MSRILRVTLLLVVGLVLLWRGLQYFDSSRHAADSRMADAAPAAQRPPAPPPGLPPASPEDLMALQVGDPEAVQFAATQLTQRAVTPEVLEAVNVALTRMTSPKHQLMLHCVRARSPQVPLAEFFDVLPAETRDWTGVEASCLVNAIAARAAEDPGRVRPVLVQRGLLSSHPGVLEGLRRIDMPDLPAEVWDQLRGSSKHKKRLAAEIAVALGAASKWPDVLASILSDADRGVRLAACRALVASPSPADAAAFARAWVHDPADEELARMAGMRVWKPGDLDIVLAQVAADDREPDFAREQAARLVGIHGGVDAGRTLAGVQSAPASVRAAIDSAVSTIERRHGTRLAPAAGE